MNHEKSCGAVIYKKDKNDFRYLLVQSMSGVYGFPKGHMEGTETERETALREIFEETGLHITFTEDFRSTESYMLPDKEDTSKTVIYFLAAFPEQEMRLREREILSAAFYSLSEALPLFSHPGRKRVLTEADAFLKTHV